MGDITNPISLSLLKNFNHVLTLNKQIWKVDMNVTLKPLKRLSGELKIDGGLELYKESTYIF